MRPLFLPKDNVMKNSKAIIGASIAMAAYIGTKLVNAKPMTRQEYLDLRSWELPENERGDDAGYLVEYTDGGKV